MSAPDLDTPITPHMIEREIRRLIHELRDATAAHIAARDAYAQNERAYKRAYAKALVSSEGSSAEDRKAEALLASWDEFVAADIAKAFASGARIYQESVSEQLDAARSVAVSVRESMRAG